MVQADHKPQFTPDSLIVEAEEKIAFAALRSFYRERGIKCFYCPAAEVETFADGAKLHKFDLDAHLAALNELAATHPFNGVPEGWFARLLAAIGIRKKAQP